MTVAAAGARVAVVDVSPAFHARLRRLAGPSGYAGREFRVYGFMRVRDAVRLYAALNATWDGEELAADFAVAGLAVEHEVRRLKRAYQRALVLALVAAARPVMLVVESVEEFDEPGAAALLQRAVARAPRAILTCGAAALLPAVLDAAVVDERALEAFVAGAGETRA